MKQEKGVPNVGFHLHSILVNIGQRAWIENEFHKE